MNRSVVRERLSTTTRVDADEVVVARHLEDPTRGAILCAAAPLVAGELRRRGFRTRFDKFGSRAKTHDGGSAVLAVTSWLDREGRALGFGAAAHHEDPAALAAVTEVMAEWTAVLRTRRLVLTGLSPTCWGAGRATEALENALARKGSVHVFGRMVAEEHVVGELRRRGATVVTDLSSVPEGATVVFPAHGVPPAVRAEAEARSLSIVDGTCPLVAKAHAEVRRFVRQGDTVVVIGRTGHALVDALLAQAPDAVRLVESVEDVRRLDIAVPERASFLVAPGFPVDEATGLIAALRAGIPHIRAQHPDGLCYAATDRAEAIGGVARVSDVFLVVGADDCPDARNVADRARAVGGAEVHVVSDVTEIRSHWLAPAWTVGVTSSLSARPEAVDEITAAVAGLGPLSVVRRGVDTHVSTSGSHRRMAEIPMPTPLVTAARRPPREAVC